MSVLFEGSIVGVSFEPAKTNLSAAYDMGLTHIDLIPELDNPYDMNALAVIIGGARVGYIPKPHNQILLQYGASRLKPIFMQWNLFEGEAVGLKIRVEL